MITIEDLRKKHETEKEKSDYISKIAGYKITLLTSAIAIIATLSTVTILFIDKVFKSNNTLLVKSPIGLTDILKFEISDNLKFSIVAVIFFIVAIFVGINLFSNNKLVKILAKQHADLVTVMQIFEALKNNVEQNNSELSKFLNQSETISRNLKAAPVSSLISWSDSGTIEILSKKVWSVSYSLKWLSEDRIKMILEELFRHKTHEYHYMLLQDYNNPKGFADKTFNKIKNQINSFEYKKNCRVNERFVIKKAKEHILFPLPNDISIYQEFIENEKYNSIVVINTHEFCDNNNESVDSVDLDSKYDLRFKDNIQVNRLIMWFKTVWNDSNNFDE